MKAIIKFLRLLGQLKNGEHFDTHEAIISYIKTVIDKVNGLLPSFNNYLSLFEEEDKLYKHDRKLKNTENVVLADKKRDEGYMKVKRIIEFKTYSDDPAEKEAARQLKKIMDLYKGANAAAYTENSAMITNLIQDLRLPENKEYMELLQLIPTVDKMEVDNEAFKYIYRERSVNTFAISEEKLMIARRNVDAAFYEVADNLDALYRSNELDKKDPETRELLGNMIDIINSFLLQAEYTYSVRVPSYKKEYKEGGKDKDPNKPIDPENPEGLPVLEIKNQQSTEPEESLGDFAGNIMSMEAVDRSAFNSILYPVAKDGFLKIKGNDS